MSVARVRFHSLTNIHVCGGRGGMLIMALRVLYSLGSPEVYIHL